MDDYQVFYRVFTVLGPTHLAFTCLELTMETPEQSVKSVAS